MTTIATKETTTKEIKQVRARQMQDKKRAENEVSRKITIAQ